MLFLRIVKYKLKKIIINYFTQWTAYRNKKKRLKITDISNLSFSFCNIFVSIQLRYSYPIYKR